MNAIAAPAAAATVVVARVIPRELGGFELYLVKRHGRAGFMAGAHVFPGGRVDDDDAVWGAFDPIDRARVAAVRETFEETGVLLARHESGLPVTTSSVVDAVTARVASGTSFHEALRAIGLVPDVEPLVPIAWWITPEIEPKRFDTRFFFAVVPSWQRDSAGVDGQEVTEGAWLSPRAALAACAEGRIVLAPPTLATIEELAECVDIDAVSRRAWPTRPVQPVFVVDDAHADGILALPGDALHPEREPVFAQRTRFVRDGSGRFVSSVAASVEERVERARRA